MIITIKQSKLDKVNPELFVVCSVSKEKFDDEVANFDIFLPTSDLLVGKQDKTIGKKEFKKKYKKYLKKAYTEQEMMLYTIGSAIKSGSNFCLTCSDAEYELGYLPILAEFIADYYGIEYGDSKDVLSEVKSTIKSFDKKERKLLDENPDDLSDKKKKVRKRVIKDIKSSLKAQMSSDGEDAYDRLRCRYAIETLTENLMRGDEPVFSINSNLEVVDLTPENCNMKTKDLVEEIMLPKDDEIVGDVIKKYIKAMGVKYKYDAIRELGKDKVLLLIPKLYIALAKFRSGADED